MIIRLYSELERNGCRSYHKYIFRYMYIYIYKNNKKIFKRYWNIAIISSSDKFIQKNCLWTHLQIRALYLPWDTSKGITGKEFSSGWGELLSILPPCQMHWEESREMCWLLFLWSMSPWNEICLWSTHKLVPVLLIIFPYKS